MGAWNLKNTYRNYTPDEVLQIFREDYRLTSLLEIEVDERLEITSEMTIYEWRVYHDLLPGRKLYQDFNTMFRVQLPHEAWTMVVEPEKQKTMWDLCEFIAQHATKEVIRPKRLFGQDCIDAGIFLTLKKNLTARGIDGKDVRPSTSLRSFLNHMTFRYFWAEILLTGARTFESLKRNLRSDISFWRKINIFARDRYYVDTGSIKTFGDLSKKIAENLGDDAETRGERTGVEA